MKVSGKILLWQCVCILILAVFVNLPAVAGTNQVVAVGQEVAVDYTCRFEPKGPIVATTSPDIASDQGHIKSTLFRQPGKPGPVSITAGTKNVSGISAKKFILNLDEYIQDALAQEIVGLPLNTTRTLNITAEPQTHVSRDERILKLATVRKRPRKVTVSREYLEARYPVKVEVGNKLPIFRDELDCEITAADEDVATYECSLLAANGTRMTPFGPATYVEKEHGYDLIFHPEEGDLIRMAGMIGTITEVGPKLFTIDYTKPFGGKELVCEVAVTEPAKKEPSDDPALKVADEGVGASESDVVQHTDQSGTPVEPEQEADSSLVEEGDLVQVDYTAMLDDGTVVQTTLQNVADDGTLYKVKDFNSDSSFKPEQVIAGKKAGFPGVGQNVVGMKEGETRQVTLSPQKAYGAINERKVVEIPRVKSFEKKVHIPAKDYMNRFESFPKQGDVVSVNQYLEGVIAEVRDTVVLMDLRPKKGEFEETFGQVRVEDTEETVDVVLEPELGAEFKQDKHTGRIVSRDEDGFEVNFNHPLAGKEIVLELTVTGLTKKADLEGQGLEWLEDHDAGLQRAQKEDKPVALVLYSTSCGWCEKLLNETMTDPRVTMLKDEFVWVKAEANDKRELADTYELTSFPLTVLLSPEGEVLKRLSGYKSAADMSQELNSVLSQTVAQK